MQRFITILVCLLFLTSCEDTNVMMLTGAAADAVTAITLSDEDVQNLARQAAQTSDNKNRLAPQGSRYDNRLQEILMDDAALHERKFDVKVYVSPEVNAFAMADGTIRLYSGLMDLMNDQEILFVIGHEMGHVVKEHSRKKVVLAYASSALRKGLASQENEIGQIAKSMVGSFVEKLTHAQFSQHEEKEADRYGLAVLRALGYGKDPAVSALTKLAELAETQHTFLSSHPDPMARALLIAKSEEKDEQQEALLDSILGYLKAVIVFLLALIRSILNWILSLL